MCSFFDKSVLSLVGSLANRWTCASEPKKKIRAGDVGHFYFSVNILELHSRMQLNYLKNSLILSNPAFKIC